jgi:hypothetical protein
MSRLDDTFVKSVCKNVDDCANAIQLRQYLKKYERYTFSPKIEQVFRDRIAFFKEWHCCNRLDSEAIEDIEDMLDQSIMISKTAGKLVSKYHKENNKKIVRSLVADENKGVKPLKKK